MIHILENFLTHEECKCYRDMIDDKINNEKLICFSNSSGSYNHKYKDLDLANKFYKIASDKIKHNDFVMPNNLIMWSKYEQGAEFGLHTDTGLYYDIINKLSTKYTLLVYLNDNFENGNTIFYDESLNISKNIKPVEGMCIVFDIKLWHRGECVLNGEKYWIGCEIISNMA